MLNFLYTSLSKAVDDKRHLFQCLLDELYYDQPDKANTLDKAIALWDSIRSCERTLMGQATKYDMEEHIKSHDRIAAYLQNIKSHLGEDTAIYKAMIVSVIEIVNTHYGTYDKTLASHL